MSNGYYQSFCASCRQCLRCKLRRGCRCTPLPVLDWSRDHTRDGALDFRKKKISSQNNARDLPAIKQHLARENPQIDWNNMDEFVVNLCMNCDRKWRKFRDGYLHEHDQSEQPQHSATTTDMRSTEPPPPPHVRQLNPEPASIHFESDEYNRPLITRSVESSTDETYQRKRRRRDTVMSEHHQLTSSNFALNPTSHRFFEQELHFRRTIFTPDHALQLGLAIIDLAKSQPQNPLVIDITLNGYQVFRFAMQGTGPDDDEWIRRKRNVVDRFRHSSALVQSQIDYLGSHAVERYPIHDPRYGFYPGSFPIIVSGVGVVGSITVAGSNLRADHDVIIAALQKLSTEQQAQTEQLGPEGFRQPIS